MQGLQARKTRNRRWCTRVPVRISDYTITVQPRLQDLEELKRTRLGYTLTVWYRFQQALKNVILRLVPYLKIEWNQVEQSSTVGVLVPALKNDDINIGQRSSWNLLLRVQISITAVLSSLEHTFLCILNHKCTQLLAQSLHHMFSTDTGGPAHRRIPYRRVYISIRTLIVLVLVRVRDHKARPSTPWSELRDRPRSSDTHLLCRRSR